MSNYPCGFDDFPGDIERREERQRRRRETYEDRMIDAQAAGDVPEGDE